MAGRIEPGELSFRDWNYKTRKRLAVPNCLADVSNNGPIDLRLDGRHALLRGGTEAIFLWLIKKDYRDLAVLGKAQDVANSNSPYLLSPDM